MTCQNGWWVPHDSIDGFPVIEITVPVGNDAVTANLGNVRMCGTVRVIPAPERVGTNGENILTLDGTQWSISGNLIVEDTTLQFINGGNIQLIDPIPECSYLQLRRSSSTDDYQYWMSNSSAIEYNNVDWQGEETTPPPAINATGCVYMNGRFVFKAPNIPNGENSLAPVRSDCVDGQMAVEHDIPGTCSDAVFDNTKDTTNDMVVTVSRKHLCLSSIIVASLFLIIPGIILIGIIAYFIFGSHSSGAEDGYYAL